MRSNVKRSHVAVATFAAALLAVAPASALDSSGSSGAAPAELATVKLPNVVILCTGGTIAGAGAALDEVQLEEAHLVGGRCIGRTFEPGGEPLATIDMAALRVRVELARGHVFDHTLEQRTDRVGLAHRALLPE